MVNHTRVAQLLRIERLRINIKSGVQNTEIAYGMTLVPPDRGSPERLLAWNRGHWRVKNLNHRKMDVAFAEDASLSRKGNAPTNNSLCNCFVLAVILGRGDGKVAEAIRHFALNCQDTFRAVLEPG